MDWHEITFGTALKIYLTVGLVYNIAHMILNQSRFSNDIDDVVRKNPYPLPDPWIKPLLIFAFVFALIFWTAAWPYLLAIRIVRLLGYG